MTGDLEIDHLVVLARTLDEGSRFVTEALGVDLEDGGRHAAMGTWNRLLSLGGREYLEVVAVDPGTKKPSHPRWFGLDDFDAAPRLVTWVCRTGDLTAAIASCGIDPGAPRALSRGDYRWRITVRSDGTLPLEGVQPTLMQWDGPHPASRLTDRGIRLNRLRVQQPAVSRVISMCPDDDRLEFRSGEPAAIAACFDTPDGPRWLGGDHGVGTDESGADNLT